MSDRHPTHETLEAFSNGSLSSHAARAVVIHLVGGCSECRQSLALMTGPLFAPLPDENEEVEISAELDAAYDSAISAAYAAALAKADSISRRDAARAIPGTEGLPLPGEPDFATPDVCETLM